ncbi:MAG: sulfite exporter TauE/SafE family protein [Flavobacteriales bacterium]|nr:sulfite exporter TauE/SafE family protein [Flavobacteriales bacterium]
MVSGSKEKFGVLLSLILGGINGILPCGLVYAALAGAIAFGGIQSSMLFMLLFGIGTLPMMLSVHLASSLINLKWKSRVLKLMPVAYGILGVLFILRGLDLGIPFLSPEIAADGTTLKCH